jgi:hypothetical protein
MRDNTSTTIATICDPSDGKKGVMKRAITLTLSLGIIGVGLWVLTASQTLRTACTLNGGASCINGLPFDLLGIALATTGAVSLLIQVLTWLRVVRRKPVESPQITTLHEYEVELLRDVA